MNRPVCYTIGYSGKTIEEFLEALMSHGVATLVDVRNTPLSHFKPGFNKRALRATLEEHSIGYLHLPELGVPKPVRDDARLTGNHEELFRWYDENVMPMAARLLQPHLSDPRLHPMAFMCTEADPLTCHRSRVGQAMEGLGYVCAEIS